MNEFMYKQRLELISENQKKAWEVHQNKIREDAVIASMVDKSKGVTGLPKGVPVYG